MMKKILILCIVFLCCLSVVCFADEAEYGITVVYDIDTGLSDVNAVLPDYCIGKKIMLYVIEADSDLNDLTSNTVQQQTNLISAIGYTVCSENSGELFSDVQINGGNGEYVFNITIEGSTTKYTSEKVYIPAKSSVDSFRNSLQNATSDTVYETLENELKTTSVGVDMSIYKLLSIEGRKYVADQMANKTFDTIQQIETDIVKFSLASVMEIPSSGLVLDMLLYPDKHVAMQPYIAIAESINDMEENKDLSTYKVLETLEDTDRLTIFNKVSEAGYDSRNALQDQININVILMEFDLCLGYGDVTAILNSHTDILTKLDYQSYTGNAYLNSLNKELLKKSFSSVSELEEFINDYTGPSGSGGASGSGGSGNSNGSGGSRFSGNSNGVSIAFEPDTLEENAHQETEAIPFEDMNGYDWATEAVEYLVNEGVINGKSEDVFAPQDNITREEFVKMIVVAFDIQLSENTNIGNFKDVEEGVWYEPYVETAFSNGIINGVSDTEFGVGENITRQDVAVIIHRVKGNNAINYEGSSAFIDEESISAYAKESVEFVRNQEYMTGYDDGSFQPHNFITRAEAAKVIYEACR